MFFELKSSKVQVNFDLLSFQPYTSIQWKEMSFQQVCSANHHLVFYHRRFLLFLSVSSVSSLLEDGKKVSVGREKVEKKEKHSVVSTCCYHWFVGGYWPCLEGFTVCFCHVQVQKYLICLLSFCLFLSFRMSWTSQRSTERPCLPYQQKRNGRFTAARRRSDFQH